MDYSSPQFLYVLFFLPTVFGVTLIADGIYKLKQGLNIGLFNVFFGVMTFIFLAFMFFAFRTKSIPFLGL